MKNKCGACQWNIATINSYYLKSVGCVVKGGIDWSNDPVSTGLSNSQLGRICPRKCVSNGASSEYRNCELVGTCRNVLSVGALVTRLTDCRNTR